MEPDNLPILRGSNLDGAFEGFFFAFDFDFIDALTAVLAAGGKSLSLNMLW